MQTEE